MNHYTLVHKWALRSFESIQKEYGLEQRDFYRYLQLRHYFNHNLSGVLKVEASDLMRVFLTAAGSPNCCRVISRLYRGLQQNTTENTIYVKDKWQTEGNFTITEEEWEKTCEGLWETTCSNTWREYNWKNHIRYFITPLQKRYRGAGVGCWRSCGQSVANHFHVFWECSVLNSYWREIHKHLEDVFDIDIPFQFDTLGNLPFDLLDNNDKKLILILLVASKKAITRKWMQPQQPTVDEWIGIIHEIYRYMEKLSFSLRTQEEKIFWIWIKWI